MWSVQQFRTIGSSFTTCFDWLMGGVDFTIFQGTHNPQVGIILLLLYWCEAAPLPIHQALLVVYQAVSGASQLQHLP